MGLRIKKGDQFIVIAGASKGKTGTVSKVMPETDKVVIEGVNRVKRHPKPTPKNPEGGILTKDLSMPIEGRDVLIVEDIVDTGRTLTYLLRNLETREPRSVRVCALLDKAARREVPVSLDYVGFTIPDEFVVGYGLDYAELHRNLPYVAVLDAPDLEPA